MKMITKLVAIAAMAVASTGAFAAPAEQGTEADAKKVLHAMLDTIKAKGLAAAIDTLNNGDVCQVKDVGCGVYTSEAKVVVARTKAMVDQTLPNFTDIDGKNITALLVEPHKAGKAEWTADYKFNAPGSKAIVPRRSLCAKVDAGHFACTVYTP